AARRRSQGHALRRSSDPGAVAGPRLYLPADSTMFDWVHLSIPPAPAMFAQLLVGLINGAFYAMLSLGLAVIFGLLNIINFTHGAQYMLGAFCAWFLLNALGLGYWPALILAPIIVGAFGIAIERLFLRHIYRLDPLYGLLLTFGLALI